ncbi:endonuclease SmrB [Thorsellia kenyensis]|uniref:Ribosome rescue factor SmrB n=1 Tax=Thorsellia kenyensis TaxID=1549888 RepID=A0ABV6CCD7_9GAMM
MDKFEELSLFREATKGAKILKQDVIIPKTYNKSRNAYNQFNRSKDNKENEELFFPFSDIYQPNLPTEGPMRFIQPNVDSFELKRLGRGDYTPELFLDVHGLTQLQAKREISALVTACLKESVQCACIMHGFGKNILKQNIPFWLAQHPSILAFHQATKAWGGESALLLLLNVELDLFRR